MPAVKVNAAAGGRRKEMVEDPWWYRYLLGSLEQQVLLFLALLGGNSFQIWRNVPTDPNVSCAQSAYCAGDPKLSRLGDIKGLCNTSDEHL